MSSIPPLPAHFASPQNSNKRIAQVKRLGDIAKRTYILLHDHDPRQWYSVLTLWAHLLSVVTICAQR